MIWFSWVLAYSGIFVERQKCIKKKKTTDLNVQGRQKYYKESIYLLRKGVMNIFIINIGFFHYDEFGFQDRQNSFSVMLF